MICWMLESPETPVHAELRPHFISGIAIQKIVAGELLRLVACVNRHLPPGAITVLAREMIEALKAKEAEHALSV